MQNKANRWPLGGNPKQDESSGITDLKAHSKGYHLKKQSQFTECQVRLNSILTMVYGGFGGPRH
jgi:hypothetical protein